MSAPPLILDVSGVAVLATPDYLEWIAGTADYLTSRDFWERRGLSSDDARQIATNFDNLIADIVLRKDSMGGLPIGAMISAPHIVDDDWILCDGRIVDENEYPLLHAMLSDYLIAQDIRVPNMRGKVVIGEGTVTDTFGTVNYPMLGTGGARRHALTVSELPSHTHNIGYFGTSVAGYGYVDSAAARSSGIKATEAAGGNASHNNMQPYVVMRWYIKGR